MANPKPTPAEPRRRRHPEDGVPGLVGWVGRRSGFGMGLEDPDPALSGRHGLKMADRMRRTDGQVRAIQAVIGLPIRSTHWYVEPPKGASAAEREAAELLDADLMGEMEGSFDDLLRELLRSVYLGFSVPEIEWEERDGRVAVRNVWSRNPELIERWLFDERGAVVGFVYAGQRPGAVQGPRSQVQQGAGAGSRGRGWVSEALESSGSRWERVVVGLDRCIHAAFETENGSPTGMGLWRAMYPHWAQKQALYKMAEIGFERNYLGCPYGELSENALPADREDMLDMLKLMKSTQDAAMVIPTGYKVGWLQAGSQLEAAIPFLHHHDALMARAALAQFLNLGQTSTGTQALATEQVRLFLEAEDGIARWLGEVISRTLVREWMRMNYPGAREKSGEERGKSAIRAPRVRHRPIRERNLEGMARGLSLLVSGGFLTATAADEEHVRAVAELPEVPREQLASRPEDSPQRRRGRGEEPLEGRN